MSERNSFNVDCTCGAKLLVTTADAGGERRCSCGKDIAIPSLSELRRLAGQDRYDVHIADRIRQMVRDGLLPGSANCARCGTQTPNLLNCSIECERPYANKERGIWATIIIALLGQIWALVALLLDRSTPEVHGRELVVKAPLRLCPDCAAASRKEPKLLRELIRSVAIYDRLLQEYPEAQITVASEHNNIA